MACVMVWKRVGAVVLTLAALVPRSLFAATVTLTSQADFQDAIEQTGADTTSTPGSLKIADPDIAAQPPEEARHVAVLVADDATLDSDLEFYLDAYFADTFTYGGDNADDDVIEFANVTDVSDLAGYDIVLVDTTDANDAATVPQTALDDFTAAGGRVIEDLLGYSSQRQRETYTLEKNFDYTAGAIRDMTYDGTYIWTLDDTSPERVLKIDPSTGATVATYCSPNIIPRGIQYVSGTLYISDSQAKKIYAITPAQLTPYDGVCGTRATGTTISLSQLSPAPTQPWGLTYDGANFYLVDSVSDQMYKFTISGTTITQGAVWNLTLTPKPVDLPRGLAYNAGYIYYADMNSNLIYQLSTTDGSEVDAFDPYDNWGASDEDIIGITFIDGDMWLTDDEPGVKKLYDNTSYYRDTDAYEYFSKANTSFETPSFNPKGLVYDGTFLWSVDDFNNRLYKLNATTGAVVSSCQTPGPRPAGLAYNAGTLYLSDWNTDTIYVLDPSDCSVTTSYAAPGDLSHGLAYDGTNLRLVDSGTDLIYTLNPADGSVVSSFAAPGGDGRGLAWDGSTLWMADEGDDLYYQLDATTGATLRTRSVTEFSAEGITFVNGQLWSTDDVADRIYNVDSDLLAQGELNAPSGSSGGFTYDGTFLWSVDTGTDRIYKLNKTTGAVITSYASPGNDPQDITWDGSSLWITTDADNKLYKIDPSTGTTLTSFDAPAPDPRGIVFVVDRLYTSDPITNKVYQIDPNDGSVDAIFDASGSASGALAYDGTNVWMNDTEEKLMYRLEFDDDDEGIVAETDDVYSTSITGIEFVDGELWTLDSYFDKFFNGDVVSSEPTATVNVANTFTTPYAAGDAFYFTTRNSTEAYYIQRRLGSVPETADRQILVTSSRGEAQYIHETIGSGDLLAMDFGLLGQNYEVARQTVPAVNFFFDALGIVTSEGGVHENTQPTYASFLSDLDDITAACPEAFVRTQIGTSSNSQPMYSYTYGTAGKPVAIIQTGTHGNEEQPIVGTIRWMQDLCDEYLANDDRALNMFANYEVIFIPLINPYGIANRTRYNANGVDLNRNYDYHWSDYPSHLKGTAAFSEPETQAVRDVILSNLSQIVFLQDSHSAMEISPGMTWGCDLGVTPPAIIADIHSIFTGRNEFRWFETRAGVGRWLTYDRYQSQDCTTPYYGNWIGSLGIPDSTTEVLGKKDIGTQRLVHTTAWEKSQFNAIFDALSHKTSRSVFRVDTGATGNFFQTAASGTESLPTGTSVSYRYGSSATTTEPTTWYDAYADAPANRYLFVETTLERSSFADTSPSLDALTVTFGTTPIATSLHSHVTYQPLTPGLSDLQADATAAVTGQTVHLSWTTTGDVSFVNLRYIADGQEQVIADQVSNTQTYDWQIPAQVSGSVEVDVQGTDLEEVVEPARTTLEITNTETVPEDGGGSEMTLPQNIHVGEYIRAAELPTVYLVDAHGRRRPFGDAQTFFTWEDDFSAVQVVSGSDLEQLPVGAPMTPKSGRVLIKIQSAPQVYAIEDNPFEPDRPSLRWIPSEDLAKARYGAAWADFVLDVPVTLFAHFSFDEPLRDTDAWPDVAQLLRRDDLGEK